MPCLWIRRGIHYLINDSQINNKCIKYLENSLIYIYIYPEKKPEARKQSYQEYKQPGPSVKNIINLLHFTYYVLFISLSLLNRQ